MLHDLYGRIAYDLNILKISTYLDYHQKVLHDRDVLTSFFFRFFVRSIIRHANFFTKEASFDYMEREGKLLT